MYIISNKKKDYYDGVAGTVGIDKTIVYNRQQIEIGEKDLPSLFKVDIHNHNNSSFTKLDAYHIKDEYSKDFFNYSCDIIGFCGKIYFCWNFYYKKYNRFTHADETVTHITYDITEAKDILTDKNYYGNLADNINDVLNYDAMHLFREFKTPVFVYSDDPHDSVLLDRRRYRWAKKIILNPILNDFNFYSEFDSFQAFQEIQMFIGGVLGCNEKDIIEVADKYKIAQHGFDKFSFRKDKEK